MTTVRISVLTVSVAVLATASAAAVQTGTPPAATKPQATPTAVPQREKRNRPKPENQPGAMMDAEKLAASHAGHHEMKTLEGGGVLPDGWKHRFDLPGMKLEHTRVMRHGDDLHITSGPPAIYYDPATTASGVYTVTATFTHLAKGEHREGYGPFVGGVDLDGANQQYLYFLIRQDGRFLVKQRVGAQTKGLVDWTSHSAITPFGKDGRMTNALSIVVGADHVRFLVNGIEVARQPKAVVADGIVGLRINHQLDVLVANMQVKAQ